MTDRTSTTFRCRDVLPVLYQAKVGALSLEFANPRHQHEYAALKKAKLPPEFVLLPGVIDSHDELRRASRSRRQPDLRSGRRRRRPRAGSSPSSDCGFGTFAGSELVAEDVVWAKLQSCRDGAALATRRLWGRA